jgi:hypothetical protein
MDAACHTISFAQEVPCCGIHETLLHWLHEFLGLCLHDVMYTFKYESVASNEELMILDRYPARTITVPARELASMRLLACSMWPA